MIRHFRVSAVIARPKLKRWDVNLIEIDPPVKGISGFLSFSLPERTGNAPFVVGHEIAIDIPTE